MKAVKYHQFGPPSDVLYVTKTGSSPPKADEVLVRMQLRSINPSDLLTIQGKYPSRILLPAIPGYEGVGVITEMGNEVTQFSIGQRVLGLGGMWVSSRHVTGTWQEFITMKARGIIPVPDEIDQATAAQLYINPLTAWLMLKIELKLGKGDVLIANACGSAIGRVFAEFAPIFGYELIGVTRSDACTEILSKLGVQKVINTSEEPLLETLFSYTKGRRVTAALDAVGGKAGVQLGQCVQEGGTMLHYGLLSGEQYPQNIRIFLQRGVVVKNYWLRNWVCTTPLDERIAIFSEMIEHFVHRKISLSSGPIFDLDDIHQAVEAAVLPSRTGKVMLSG